MARRTTAARRYADAAFQMAKEERTLDRWERELGVLRDLLNDPQLRAVADHPAIAYAAKERILRAAAGTDIAREPVELVLLMIRRGRPRSIIRCITSCPLYPQGATASMRSSAPGLPSSQPQISITCSNIAT